MIHFGIIGPGKISHRFIQGMQDVEGAKIVAVGSRSIEKSKAVCEEYCIDKYYGSYLDLLLDQDVHAVYIATPPHTHKELILLSLAYGKHVLCEKPLMARSVDVHECFNKAKENKLILMEANKCVFTPIYHQAEQWVNEGIIGKILYIDGSYSYRKIFDKEHWVYWGDEAGGGMYDVGIYPLGFIHCLLNCSVLEKKSMAISHENKCNGFEQMLLRYSNDVMVSVRGGIDIQTENKLMIYGEEGFIESTNFWKSHDIKCVKNNQVIERHFDFKSEFTFEIQHFIDCIKNGLLESPIMSSSRSIELLQLMEK